MKIQIRSQRGFTTMESLVTVLVFVISIVAIGTVYGMSLRTFESQKLGFTRDRIFGNLTRIATSPASLRASTYPKSTEEPFNVYFNTCIRGGGAKCYNQNGDGEYKSFRLYLPMVENTDPTAEGGRYGYRTSGAITGTRAYPMRYNLSGLPCDLTQSVCPRSQFPIEVFTEFLPTCPSIVEAVSKGWAPESMWVTPVYPEGLKPIPDCPFARFIKIKLTIRASQLRSTDPVGLANHIETMTAIPDTEVVTTVDVALARYARQ